MSDLKRIYYVSLFLMLIPPFTLFFSSFNVNSIANTIWVVLFIVIGILLFKKKIKLKGDNQSLKLFLLFFAAQSVSVITAANMQAFWQRDKDIVVSGIFFIISLALLDDKASLKKIMFIMLAAGAINIALEFFIFFYPEFFSQWGGVFLHKGYLDLIMSNINRSRIYIESYDEILIPILVYFLAQKIKVASLIMLLPLVFFSFASNFRTRSLMLGFALGTSAITLLKSKTKMFIFFMILTPMLFYIFYTFLARGVGFTTIERLLLEDKQEDVLTVTGRIDRWRKAAEIGFSSPIFGVGLGNYYDNLSIKEQKSFSILRENNEAFERAAQYPHNIFFHTFAETGLVGLLSFLLLLVYFVKKDASIVIKGDNLSKMFVISFWTLFIHSLFNPAFTTRYLILFWLLRISIGKASFIMGRPK